METLRRRSRATGAATTSGSPARPIGGWSVFTARWPLGVRAAAGAAAPLVPGAAGRLDRRWDWRCRWSRRATRIGWIARSCRSATGRRWSSSCPAGRRCSTTPAGWARRRRPRGPCPGYLWSRGITHLDAVVISHADADHYNALPALLEQFSVGAVYVSPVMFDHPSAALAALQAGDRAIGRAAARSLERRPVAQRRRRADRSAAPAARAACWAATTPTASCWRSSIEGRRLLLTGDLESPGLGRRAGRGAARLRRGVGAASRQRVQRSARYW